MTLWQEAAVPGLILAVVNPDNTPHGYNWTFAFPMLLFIVIAAILYALFSRPHRRVPGRPVSAAATVRMPEVEIAQAAAVAAGPSLAPGGGAAESLNEPAGGVLVAERDSADLDSAEGALADSDPADGGAQPDQAAPERTEGSE